MIDKSRTSLSDVEINALEQIMNESNFYNSITVAESPFSSIAVFDDNDELDFLIEYQGIQHYKPKSVFGGYSGLHKQQFYDMQKR